MWFDLVVSMRHLGENLSEYTIALIPAQCSNRIVQSMYNKFVNGVELGYLMNLKALLGLKFAHDHNWHLSRNFGLDLLILLSLDF